MDEGVFTLRRDFAIFKSKATYKNLKEVKFMPTYDFKCKKCNKEFSLVLTIKEHDEKGFKCPHCNSTEVEQQYSTFFAKTSRKS